MPPPPDAGVDLGSAMSGLGLARICVRLPAATFGGMPNPLYGLVLCGPDCALTWEAMRLCRIIRRTAVWSGNSIWEASSASLRSETLHASVDWAACRPKPEVAELLAVPGLKYLSRWCVFCVWHVA